MATKLELKVRKIKNVEKHDIEWLNMIIAWAPERGISLKEQARWFKLVVKTVDLPDDKPCEIELSDKDIIAIEDRLLNPDFRLTGMSIHFAMFMLELKDVLGLRRLETIINREDSIEDS